MKNIPLRLANFALKGIFLLFLLTSMYGQQPQIANTNPQVTTGTNSKWVQGIGTGFKPYCVNSACTGLTFNIDPGTCFDSTMVRHVTSTTTVLTLTNSATNYVFLNQSNCAITQNTAGYGTTGVPIASIVTSGGNVSSFIDDRNFFITNILGAATGGGSGSNTFQCVNDVVTGTVINKLARITGNSCIKILHADPATDQLAGLVTGGAGTTGTATVLYSGQGSCVFDNGTTAGDNVVWSITAGHDAECHDTGGRGPQNYGNNYNVGTAVSTNVGAGTYLVDIHPAFGADSTGNGRYLAPVYNPFSPIPLPGPFGVLAFNDLSSEAEITSGLPLCFLDTNNSGAGCMMSVASAVDPTFPGSRWICNHNAAGNSCTIYGGLASTISNQGGQSGTVNLGLQAGVIQSFTATGNVTVANPTNIRTGQIIIMHLCQNGTGGWAFSWGSSFVNPPSPTTTASACTDALFEVFDTTHIYTVASGNGTGGGGGGTYVLPSQYKIIHCDPGIGDGLNSIPANTYPLYDCYNDTSVTWTVTNISCYTDNNGTSTLDVKNNAGTSLLTGVITCTNTKSTCGAAGTQSGTTTIPANDAFNFTFIADGSTKTTTWCVGGTQ